MNNVDTGGPQGQTQVSEGVNGGSPNVGGTSGGGIKQAAVETAKALLGGGGGGSLEDKPIERTTLAFGEFSSSIMPLLASPLMFPLLQYGGVVFPNTPRISVTYATSYSQIEMSHSNYDYQSFNKSTIQNVSMDAKFTAQTVDEADYLLAVIHFFRTFNKMNFGENDLHRGRPPAILKLSAYGDYMINNHPVAIRSFAMNLPDHVDYVQTSHNTQVPVYFEMNVDLVTMMTPNKVKNEFSLDAFATGNLITKGYL